MSRTRIKICGITREEDLADPLAAGADPLGIVFYAQCFLVIAHKVNSWLRLPLALLIARITERVKKIFSIV